MHVILTHNQIQRDTTTRAKLANPPRFCSSSQLTFDKQILACLRAGIVALAFPNYSLFQRHQF